MTHLINRLICWINHLLHSCMSSPSDLHHQSVLGCFVGCYNCYPVMYMYVHVCPSGTIRKFSFRDPQLLFTNKL